MVDRKECKIKYMRCNFLKGKHCIVLNSSQDDYGSILDMGERTVRIIKKYYLGHMQAGECKNKD